MREYGRRVRTMNEAENAADNDRKREKQRREVKAYLRRYEAAQAAIQRLRVRRREMILAAGDPRSMTTYNGGGRPQGGHTDKAAEAVVRLERQEERIKEQEREAERIKDETAATLYMLPIFSPAREVLELVYIDGMTIDEVSRHINRGETVTRERIAAGLDLLIDTPATWKRIHGGEN